MGEGVDDEAVAGDNDADGHGSEGIVVWSVREMRSSHNLLLVKEEARSLRRELYSDVRYNES